MNSNTPAFADIPNLAAKFHIEDISVRAYAGRVSKVSGIKVTPKMMVEILGDDSLTKESAAIAKKLNKWIEKQVGPTVMSELAVPARPFMFNILTAYLVGFVPAEILTRKFVPTKKMLSETGGKASTRWDMVLEDIEKFQSTKSKKKPK